MLLIESQLVRRRPASASGGQPRVVKRVLESKWQCSGQPQKGCRRIKVFNMLVVELAFRNDAYKQFLNVLLCIRKLLFTIV